MSISTFQWFVPVLLGLNALGLYSLGRRLESIFDLIFDYLYEHKGFRRKP